MDQKFRGIITILCDVHAFVSHSLAILAGYERLGKHGLSNEIFVLRLKPRVGANCKIKSPKNKSNA